MACSPLRYIFLDNPINQESILHFMYMRIFVCVCVYRKCISMAVFTSHLVKIKTTAKTKKTMSRHFYPQKKQKLTSHTQDAKRYMQQTGSRCD